MSCFLPVLYIKWKENGEDQNVGPFYTISPDGNGFSIGQNWMAYRVQTQVEKFERIIIPTAYHFIVAKCD